MNKPPSEVEALVARLTSANGRDEDMAETLTAIVAEKNRRYSMRYLRTPYADRLVLLPQCLRSTEHCQATEHSSDYVCARCRACRVDEILTIAGSLGYKGVRLLKGGSAVMRVIEETRPKALLAVCCPIEAVMGVVVCERLGVPAFCVPLLRAGCSDTDVDMNDLRSVMEAIVT
ncbi:MAG: DUF116 domain-containing protein [Candidatus Brocadiaceae bacterium]|nr:DUF116 domain-containing protein [Candidatus Brocadiaceae bacterium]